MSTELIIPDTKEEEDKANVVPLRLITGGKGTQDPVWLNNLGVGTVFLIKEKAPSRSFVLGEYVIREKTEKSVWLITQQNGEQHSWVEPTRFSNMYDLWEILRSEEEFQYMLKKNEEHMKSLQEKQEETQE